MRGLVYDDNPAYSAARRITRDPTEKEADAIAELIRTIRRAAAQAIAEEQHERRRGA